MLSAQLVAAGMALDALVGDPRWLWSRVPHPVTLMGRSLMVLEAALNRPHWPGGWRRAAGSAALLVYLTAWTVPVFWYASVSSVIYIDVAVAAVLLAGRSLMDHVSAVARALDGAEGLGPARAAVAEIVGRDTSALDGSAIARAAIESLAENLSDGYVAPVFWLAVAGLPGLVFYKAVNTADSLIGHRSERFARFGWAAARLDDVLNWVPARITAGLLALAASEEERMQESWNTARRDAAGHLSPNAGWPEAAMAGALGVRLGGPRRYGDREVAGVWFGDGTEAAEAAEAADIRRALRLARRVWFGTIAVAAAIAIVPL